MHTAPGAAAWAACAAGALGVALLHAYDLVVVYAVVGTYWIVELVRARSIPWRLSWAIIVILACSAPLAGYYQYLTSSDPLWRAMLGSTSTPASGHRCRRCSSCCSARHWCSPRSV